MGDSSEAEASSDETEAPPPLDDDESSDDSIGRTLDARRATKRQRASTYSKSPEKRLGADKHRIFFTDAQGVKQRESFFGNALRNGALGRVRPGFERTDAAARDALAIMNSQLADGLYSGPGHQVNTYQQACAEAAVLELFPQSKEAAMIRDWRDSSTDPDVVCTFEIWDIGLVASLLTFYTAARTEKMGGHVCYGVGFSRASALLGAISSMYRSMGVTSSPSKHPSIRLIMWGVEKRNDPKGGPSFDPATDLLPMVEAMMAMGGVNFAKRVLNTVMFLIQWVIMGRGSDVSIFAPDVSGITFPKKTDRHHWGKDGQPLWFDMTLTQAKGIYLAQKGRARTLRIYANQITYFLDPVYWMQLWLEVSGIRKGSIFVRFAKGGKVVSEYYETRVRKVGRVKYLAPYDAAGKFIGITVPMWTLVLTSAWKKLTWVDLVPHFMRKTSIKWVGHCYGKAWEINNNSGHSEKSTPWLRYIEAGAMDRAEATLGPDNTYRRDPIFSVWTWCPVTFTARGR
ncbi:hypothetical protein M885DRAFT_507643 [Pelagophyceae sp. CCMP2097]|nr:hypothetical protein M885DRAFT_507643 [Pelagophyceae sp. CCMP2097]